MLRFLVGTGVGLMLIGFGAAGWQYLQGSAPANDSAASKPTATFQDWLISPTGGLVPPDNVRAYLVQDRYVASRTVRVIRSARLVELLAEGETLPAQAYLAVLADIRAPRLAEPLCAQLVETLASDCAVAEARLVPDSLNPTLGTATFALDLVFRERLAAVELPDLATHVLRDAVVTLQPEAGTSGTESPEAALAAAISAARAACPADEASVGTCRVTDLAVDWQNGMPISLSARVAWLAPLPDGVIPAPPILPAAGG